MATTRSFTSSSKVAMKVRAIIFSVVICLLLASPTLLLFVEKTGAKVPSWLSSEDATYLSGGIAEANVGASANLHGFVNGEFQNAVSNEVGNHIPCKATALLTNASLQRCAIAASNVLFRYDIYPTYYGSLILLDTKDDRLLEMPEKANPSIIDSIVSTSNKIDQFELSHPDLTIFVYLVLNSRDAEGVPTADLISNPLTASLITNSLENKAYVHIDSKMSFDSFRSLFYKSDHHMNSLGSLELYSRVADALQLEQEALGRFSLEEINYPLFFGSCARRGLITDISDKLEYYHVDAETNLISSFSTKAASDSKLLHDELYNNSEWNPNLFSNRYAELFHGDPPLIEITNTQNNSSENLLIVSDSYSSNIERFLALHFNTTYIIDTRTYKGTLDDFLKEHNGINKVLFLMNRINFTSDSTLCFLR